MGELGPPSVYLNLFNSYFLHKATFFAFSFADFTEILLKCMLHLDGELTCLHSVPSNLKGWGRTSCTAEGPTDLSSKMERSIVVLAAEDTEQSDGNINKNHPAWRALEVKVTFFLLVSSFCLLLSSV